MVRFLNLYLALLILQGCVLFPSSGFSISGANLDYINSQGQLPSGVRFRQVATTENSSCVVSEENEIWCWGEDLFSIENGVVSNVYYEPTKIEIFSPNGGNAGVEKIALGLDMACALFTDGYVKCADTNEPYSSDTTIIFEDIIAGTNGACAKLKDRSSYNFFCFGWSRALMSIGTSQTEPRTGEGDLYSFVSAGFGDLVDLQIADCRPDSLCPV